MAGGSTAVSSEGGGDYVRVQGCQRGPDHRLTKGKLLVGVQGEERSDRSPASQGLSWFAEHRRGTAEPGKDDRHDRDDGSEQCDAVEDGDCTPCPQERRKLMVPSRVRMW
jgi:hypothetical protein